MSSTRALVFTAPVALLAALFTSSAQAQSTCEANGDCPAGYECQVTASGSCPGYACVDGEDCPEPEPCETVEYRDCVAVPDACASDADCDAGMACVTQTYENCSTTAYACAPDEECPEPADPVCESKSETSCVPRYLLPCATAADCGAGFECKPMESCACSGSSGTEPAPDSGSGDGSSGDADGFAPPEESCTCTPSDTNSCVIVERACSSDLECPADWTCVDSPNDIACGAPEGDGTDVDCGGTSAEKICLPPYADTVVGVDRGGEPVYASDDDASGESGVNEAAPTSGGPTGGSAEDSDSGDSAGCSVAGNAGGSSGAWLLLVGLAALLAGGRKRRA
jgi:MYXO-CTERM domain-containing protein